MRQRGFAPIIFSFLVVVVAILAAGGAYYWHIKEIQGIQSFDQCVQAGYPVLETFPEQCKTPDGRSFAESIPQFKAQPSPSANWQTYTNSKYSYSANYPSDWQAVEAQPSPSGNIIVGDKLDSSYLQQTTFRNDVAFCQIGVQANPKDYDTEQWANNYQVLSAPGSNLAKVVGDSVLGGIPAKKISVFEFDGYEIVIAAVKDSLAYLFSYDQAVGNPNSSPEQEQAQSTCEQILASFKFEN